MSEKSMKIVMYPWFAMGHFLPFLHFANKLAERGHQIFFIIPAKTQPKLQQFNLHPDLIEFKKLKVPQVEGLLPLGAETTADISVQSQPFLRLAMDLTRHKIEILLQEIKPHVMFQDFQHWLPMLAHQVGAVSVFLSVTSPTTISYSVGHGEDVVTDKYLNAPPGYPSSDIKLSKYEVLQMCYGGNSKAINSDITFLQRLLTTISQCDAISFRTIGEMEGAYCNYIEKIIKKPVLSAGLIVPEMTTKSLEEKWEIWLNGYKPKSVIFCAFGSESRLEKDQFQEMILGLELTGQPFIAALKPPVGFETIEEALPNGIAMRIQDRGIIFGGWVPQQLILSHSSVGCFVSHCGSGSITEALVNECQMVLLPHRGDQFIFGRVLSVDIKVGVEIETGYENGKFTKEGVCRAIQMVMDEENEVGKVVRENHEKFRQILLEKVCESAYIDEFVEKLKGLLVIQKNVGAN